MVIIAPEVTSDEDSGVNISNLDFAQAKEFGSYLVVPIRHKHKHSPDVNTSLPGAQTCAGHDGDAASDPQFSDMPSDSASCTYPGDAGSSGDSAIADVSHDHVHCTRCHRPHGVFNGITLAHFDENIDLQNIDIQTYFNKAMLGDQLSTTVTFEMIEDSEGSKVKGTQESDSPEQRQSHKDREIRWADKGDNTMNSDGNDTGNEYDVRSSDLSSQSHSRPSSFAFDSASSLYAFSGSERDMTSQIRTAHVRKRHPMPHQRQESDSSNDTFSEYDIQSGGDYEYFLSRVQHNLWLKKEVMRVIRESESSEYETAASVAPCSCPCSKKNPDDISLTSVSSLSEMSLSEKEDVNSDGNSKNVPSVDKHERVKKGEHSKSCVHGKTSKHKTKNKSKSRHRSERRDPENIDESFEHAQNSNVPAWERLDRRQVSGEYRKAGSRRKSSGPNSSKKTEVYCLPDFPTSPGGDENGCVDPDSMERLSCRATNFNPPPAVKSVRTATRAVTSRGTSGSQRTQPQRAQNRMLTDLMKMNHDRLLVLF